MDLQVELYQEGVVTTVKPEISGDFSTINVMGR